MKVDHLKKIDGILNEIVDTEFAAGASVMILLDGKPVYTKEVGYGDLENKTPVKPDSIFRLYSMSKPITSAAAMLLMEDGLLDINRPVGDYLEAYKEQTVGDFSTKLNRPMKVKDLLDMTAGLSYGGVNNITEVETSKLWNEAVERMDTDNEMTTREFADRLAKVPLLYSPGESFSYSFCADILGAVIEEVSGMKFGEFLKKRLFEPLNMVDTGFYVPKEKQDRLVKVYERTEEGLKEYHFNHLGINLKMEHAPAFESGGAGLCTTILDYANFARMLMNNGEFEGKQIMMPGTVKFMTGGEMNENAYWASREWDGLDGWHYANLLRVLKKPGLAVTFGSAGEYGWDGWLGPNFMNDPAHRITILHMLQRTDTGTTTFVRRIRNVVYASLED